MHTSSKANEHSPAPNTFCVFCVDHFKMQICSICCLWPYAKPDCTELYYNNSPGKVLSTENTGVTRSKPTEGYLGIAQQRDKKKNARCQPYTHEINWELAQEGENWDQSTFGENTLLFAFTPLILMQENSALQLKF